ncbi:MAG: alpha/beta hydrolase [bacterium]|nr:alpha/beta hydrolase [bacterium]
MKKQIIIVHGWGGSPTNDWIAWATEAFQEKGYEVLTLEMPGTDNPVIEKWVEHIRLVAEVVDENTYFIGHSIGCQAIMRFLETVDARVGGAIFVAGWFNLTNQSEEEKVIAKAWIETPIEYAKVKVNLTSSVAILSNNDPYVPYEETKKCFETRLGSEVITVHEAGHFTSGDGFGPFPQLVEIFENHFK